MVLKNLSVMVPITVIHVLVVVRGLVPSALQGHGAVISGNG